MLLSIQYLRAFAALGVVAHHTGWAHTLLGQAGVDVFFVISGFIMVRVSQREPTPGAFLRARFIRVVPLYWLATALAVARLRPTAADAVQSFLFWPHVNSVGHFEPVLYPGWSLVYEVFFYLVFAASLRAPAAGRLPAIAAVLGTVIVAGLFIPASDIAASEYTRPIMAEFLAGALLGQAWQRGLLPGPRISTALTAAGIVLLAAQFGALTPVRLRAIVWGLPALMIVAGALGLEAAGRMPRLRPLHRLGDASYSLYLSHVFALELVLHRLHTLPIAVAFPAAAGFAVAVAFCVHYAVERPLTRALSRLGRGEATG